MQVTAIHIFIELIGSLELDYKGNIFSISAVADEARNLFEAKIAKIKSKGIETPNQVNRQK